MNENDFTQDQELFEVSGGAGTSPLTVVVNLPQSSGDNSISSDVSTDSANFVEPLTLQSVSVSSERITSAGTNGLKSEWLSLIGDYETIVTDYTYSNTSGYITHSVDVQPDFAWISASVTVLCLFLSCLRILSFILKGFFDAIS